MCRIIAAQRSNHPSAVLTGAPAHKVAEFLKPAGLIVVVDRDGEEVKVLATDTFQRIDLAEIDFPGGEGGCDSPEVLALSVAPDGDRLFVSTFSKGVGKGKLAAHGPYTYEHRILSYSANPLTKVGSMKIDRRVCAVAVSPAGPQLVAGIGNHLVLVEGSRALREVQLPQRCHSLHFAPCGKEVVAICSWRSGYDFHHGVWLVSTEDMQVLQYDIFPPHRTAEFLAGAVVQNELGRSSICIGIGSHLFILDFNALTKIASIDLDIPMILCLESAHNALAIGYRDNVMLLHLGSLDPLAKSDLEPMEGGEDSDSNSDLPPPKRVS